MTVSTTNSRDLATGNGTVGPFTFTFTLQQAADMNVYVSGSVISAGLYTITPNGGSYPCVGGSISWNLLANAPATGVPLVFVSAVPNTQTLSLPIETDFPEKSLENAIDRNTLQIQQLKLLTDLSLHFAVTENVNALLSGPKALYIPRMNAANTGMEFVSAAQIANEVTAGNGNVVGPATSTARTLAMWNNTNGTLLKDGPAIGTAGQVLTSQGAGVDPIFASAAGGSNSIQDGRLTLTTGVSRTTSDVLAATNVYFTPDIGNCISLYNGSSWSVSTFSEITISLASLTNALPYDIFAYLSGSTVVAEIVAWSSSTTRATALAKQDGVYCKSGSLTKRYVGTVLMSATGQCEDSTKHRGVYNANNRIGRSLLCTDPQNSWTYALTAYREINAGSTLGISRVAFITGLAEDLARFEARGMAATTGATNDGFAGVGIDSSTVNSAQINTSIGGAAGGYTNPITAVYRGYPAIGSHTARALEACSSATSKTFYGDNNTTNIQSGMFGEVWC